MADNGLVPIGELARRTGVATSALRYYERLGLLPPAERAGGKRHYPPASAERVALIRLYQEAGFTLAEIGPMVATVSRGRRAWGRLAERKVAELDARIAEARRAKRLIEHALNCTPRRPPHLSQVPSRASIAARSGPTGRHVTSFFAIGRPLPRRVSCRA